MAQLGASLIGGVASSALGSLFGPKLSPEERQVMQGDVQAQRIGLQSGQNLLGMGTTAVQQPMNYWSSILSGNKGLATSALAPDIQRIGEGYNAAQKTSAALMPRGGPSSSFLANQPFQQQRDVTSLFQQARPQAAQQLGGLGGQLLGQGANSLYASTAAGRNVLDTQANLRQLAEDRGARIGGGLFSNYAKYGQNDVAGWLSKIFGQKDNQTV